MLTDFESRIDRLVDYLCVSISNLSARLDNNVCTDLVTFALVFASEECKDVRVDLWSGRRVV